MNADRREMTDTCLIVSGGPTDRKFAAEFVKNRKYPYVIAVDAGLAVCEELGIPVEINANGYRDKRAYPDRRVWELSRQYRLTWLINSDAHEVAHLCDEAGVGGTEAFARELGIPVTEWFDW